MQELITPQIALAVLLELKDEIDKGNYHQYAICNGFRHINWKYDRDYGLRDYMSQAGIKLYNWPKFSGSSMYPVPSDTQLNCIELFNVTNNYWDKTIRYGRDRRELLDWLIEQFKTVINNKVMETEE